MFTKGPSIIYNMYVIPIYFSAIFRESRKQNKAVQVPTQQSEYCNNKMLKKLEL